MHTLRIATQQLRVATDMTKYTMRTQHATRNSTEYAKRKTTLALALRSCQRRADGRRVCESSGRFVEPWWLKHSWSLTVSLPFVCGRCVNRPVADCKIRLVSCSYACNDSASPMTVLGTEISYKCTACRTHIPYYLLLLSAVGTKITI